MAPDAFVGDKVARKTADALACSIYEARKYARRVVARLKTDDFCGTDAVPFDCGVADVYGVKNSEGAWYVKVQIQQQRSPPLVILSCHPLEFRLKRSNGTWLDPET